ncbi:MAG TPA: PIG-L family deacetylase [Nitrospira sp.]|uniref:PIG-L deacetylase family protein n=1 Tax=Accumulibacter sp. TaxID=2053492 RepID=UPI002B6441B4|nr:PIG-L deacetylase family protein [Accumulibacter sp.]HMV56137.1 PIG-L family deacetylase [Nitrospira sp.]HNB66612.1 PIG-L family deacetylase [Accumulibacter sp.]
MLKLILDRDRKKPLRLLCIGAHSDDLEIGCAGTLLSWIDSDPEVEIRWVVLSAGGKRAAEARSSAKSLFGKHVKPEIVLGGFRDGFMPSQYAELKTFFETLKIGFEPDIVLTHYLGDRHQDHRLAAELTWNTWRNHLIFEYEIPKYEGDLAQPNAYVPIAKKMAERKIGLLGRHFSTQRNKDWFVPENFYSIMRLRGIECRSPSGMAEAFHVRKWLLQVSR